MTYAQRTDLVIVLGIIMVTLVILAAALPAPRPSTQPAIPVAEIPAAIGTASRETVSVGTASGKGVASRTGASGMGVRRRPTSERGEVVAAALPSTASPSVAPLRTVRARAAGVVRTLAARSIYGIATWYRYRIAQAAAGPSLRRALGKGWRGRLVHVSVGSRAILVRLTDYMVANRLIDLDSRSFRQLTPLSRGIVRVRVSW